MSNSNLYVEKFTEKQIQQFKSHLIERSWDFSEIPYSHWKAQKNKTTVVAYLSGKITVQGKGTVELVEFFIEPEITGVSIIDKNEELTNSDSAEQFLPHCGIDESGKGDYFGPLVIACVYTEKETAKELIKIGVTDSKNIKNDKKAIALAEKIKKIVGYKYTMVSIGSEAYNDFYERAKNLNKMLGWGHARVLENLLEKVPDCQLAISDKFSVTGSVNKALMDKGKKVKLIQRTKAESDIAVAAASIIARAEFLTKLDTLGKSIGMKLPKGASQFVLDAAKDAVKKNGEEVLKKIAKLHFKTTQKVLGNI